MLKELSRYEHLGTPQYFFELFTKLANNGIAWTERDIEAHFYNRIIGDISVFDGCVPLAKLVGAITIDGNGLVTLSPTLLRPLVNRHYLALKLLATILLEANKDDTFHEIFCPDNISYDIIYRQIQVDSASFPFRYANFRQLLIDFEFLLPHPDPGINKYIINPKIKNLFSREILPSIKKRKLGAAQLEKMLAQQQIHGKEAEEFVLKYEQQRLASHPQLKNVEIISEYDVGAGYDIVSYADINSTGHDRFIEVKSFQGPPSFHWSRNEIDVSRIKKGEYFLYLVDRARMNDAGYHPLMIPNPFDCVLGNNSQWETRIEEYFIKRLDAR